MTTRFCNSIKAGALYQKVKPEVHMAPSDGWSYSMQTCTVQWCILDRLGLIAAVSCCLPACCLATYHPAARRHATSRLASCSYTLLPCWLLLTAFLLATCRLLTCCMMHCRFLLNACWLQSCHSAPCCLSPCHLLRLAACRLVTCCVLLPVALPLAAPCCLSQRQQVASHLLPFLLLLPLAAFWVAAQCLLVCHHSACRLWLAIPYHSYPW